MSGIYALYDQHLVAVDNIIFGYDENELKLLLVKRELEPQKGGWSLMGGFIKSDESLDQAAARVVRELTGLERVYMEQFYTYGAVNRDPGARAISVAYYTLIRVDLSNSDLGEQYGAQWFPIDRSPTLIFDHQNMVDTALMVLQRRSRSEPLGFELLPDKFTIPQLRQLYEAINRKKLDHGNFSKRLRKMKLLTRLDEKDKSHSKKGAYYYRFDRDRYEQLKSEGLTFDLK